MQKGDFYVRCHSFYRNIWIRRWTWGSLCDFYARLQYAVQVLSQPRYLEKERRDDNDCWWGLEKGASLSGILGRARRNHAFRGRDFAAARICSWPVYEMQGTWYQHLSWHVRAAVHQTKALVWHVQQAVGRDWYLARRHQAYRFRQAQAADRFSKRKHSRSLRVFVWNRQAGLDQTRFDSYTDRFWRRSWKARKLCQNAFEKRHEGRGSSLPYDGRAQIPRNGYSLSFGRSRAADSGSCWKCREASPY